MAYWMCTSCGHCANESRPPDECPHCGKRCSFGDVTCYRPECGGEHNIDPLLTSALRGASLKAVDKIANEARRRADSGDNLMVFNSPRNWGAEW